MTDVCVCVCTHMIANFYVNMRLALSDFSRSADTGTQLLVQFVRSQFIHCNICLTNRFTVFLFVYINRRLSSLNELIILHSLDKIITKITTNALFTHRTSYFANRSSLSEFQLHLCEDSLSRSRILNVKFMGFYHKRPRINESPEHHICIKTANLAYSFICKYLHLNSLPDASCK